MTNYAKILEDIKEKLIKSLGHLAYSYNKIQQLPDDVNEMDDEAMETWESFASRFGRAADIFLTRYIRTSILLSDPGFEGSLRDTLNKAEKMNMLDDVATWMEIRELRNVAVHDYNNKTLTTVYRRLKELCPMLLDLQDKL